MPQTPHIERHFTANDSVGDVAIGRAHHAVRAGGGALGCRRQHRALAEIAAGGIAMGLDRYLAARSDAEHYTMRSRASPWH